MRRPSINITRLERSGRIGLGVVGIVAGFMLLRVADSTTAFVLELLLVAAGLDLLITGALGHCPLYAKLGREPVSPRKQT